MQFFKTENSNTNQGSVFLKLLVGWWLNILACCCINTDKIHFTKLWLGTNVNGLIDLDRELLQSGIAEIAALHDDDDWFLLVCFFIHVEQMLYIWPDSERLRNINKVAFKHILGWYGRIVSMLKLLINLQPKPNKHKFLENKNLTS